MAASCALLGVCVAGGPLYVSSAASESVQLQLADICLSDVAVHLPYSPDPVVVAALDRAYSTLRQVQEPIITASVSATYRLADTPKVRRKLVLIHRDGQETQFDPQLPALADNTVLMPDYLLTTGEYEPGTTELMIQEPPMFQIGSDGQMEPMPDPAPISMLMVGTYPTIPVRPEPDFWCGWRKELRPNSRGDLPPPLVFANLESIRQYNNASGDWEVQPIPDGMTRDDAHAFQRRQDAAIDQFATELGVPDLAAFRHQFAALSSMGVLADRADTVSDLVGKTMAPVRLAGVAVSLLVLCASGVMVARERRRELRLIAIRGGGPAASMPALLKSMALPTVGGAVVGLGLAVLGVRTLGPTPEMETGPFRFAVVSAVVGGLVALLLVTAVTALAGDREVDARPRRIAWRHVPFELIVPALAVAAWVRLDQVGGVRLVGTKARGGDLLAQSFPLLALATPVAILVRPLRALLRRMRHVGRRLPDAPRLGVRRAVAEPLMAALVVLASAFAAGCLVLSTTLLVSAEQQLVDKATTFVGSDLSVRIIDDIEMPAGLADRATVVGRVTGNVDGTPVSILAIDPATFAGAVHWKDDPELDGLPGLLERLAAAGDRAGVIVVGDVPDSFDLVGRTRGVSVPVDVIARLDHFPGFTNGTPMVIIDRSVADAGDLGPFGTSVWVRDPPDDAVQLLRDAGARITNEALRVEDVFDVTSFRAVRWSYSALGAFGVFVAFVVFMMQILAIDARRQRRQAAHVLMRRMGFGRRRLVLAGLVEVSIPLILGVGFGVVMGITVAEASVRRLDTLRQLRPPSVVVVDIGSIVAVGIGTVLAVALLTLLTVVSTARAKPLEVMRGTV